MLEVMTESHEDPRERRADTGGRSESGSDPQSPTPQESASDLGTIIEQRTPVTSAVLSKRPPERETLASVLSQVCKDPIEIDAVIKEIGARSDELVQISIKMLELVLSTELETQGESLDKQHEEIRAQSANIDKQGEDLASLRAKLFSQGAKLHEHNEALASQCGEIRARGEKLASLGGEVRAIGTKLDALGMKLDAGFYALRSDIRSLRREMRLMLAVLTLLVAVGLFGWFGQGCSRPIESHAGVEASQTAAAPSPGTASVPVATPEPSAEAVETVETALADKPPGLTENDQLQTRQLRAEAPQALSAVFDSGSPTLAKTLQI